MTLNLDMEKSRARLQAKKIRAEAFNPAGAIELIRHFPTEHFKGRTIGGFWPIQSEIDVRPLMDALEAQGFSLSLPCTPRPGKPLTFRSWGYGEKLKKGPHNTREPFADKSEVFPDVVLVPLLAFTDMGDRLGYGGGFYDRTLARLRDIKTCELNAGEKNTVFACGVAYAAQKADHLPIGQYDAPLSGMLTDQYFRKFS